MSVSFVLHRSCDSDLWVRFSGDCFDIQFRLLSAAALRSSAVGSNAFLVSCPPEHQTRKERWAAASFHKFPRPRESLSGIDNAEITDFNFKRNSTLTCSAICRSLALGLLPSGHNGLLVQTLISFSSGCHLFRLSLRKGGSRYSPGLVPVWCLPEQESFESNEPPGSFLPLLRRFFGAAASHNYAYALGVSPDWCLPVNAVSSLLPYL